MKKITAKSQDYAKWYTDVVAAAELADYAPVKGCMVIRPYGFSIWENIQHILDQKIKETGHQNAYFPLFIPKSFFSKEASHVEGFAKECAVVTHYRLKTEEKKGKTEIVIDPESKLEEELIVRPTSETVINAMFAKWVDSWRDLPILINQWANIVRWEMRTRLFLRTAEFLWQEGHTAHATAEEAQEETIKMLNVYKDFMENYLAVPVVAGVKTASERFAGATETYTVEAMMQDRKALQAGTSHNLGQNFAKAFGTSFNDKDGKQNYVWQTSWGVSTRLIGALIMTHADDNGLVMPPKVAPIHVVIIPIYKTDEEQEKVFAVAEEIKKQLSFLRVEIDKRDKFRPGRKFYEWEKKGVPLRIEIGPRDVAQNKMILANRVTGEKTTIDYNENIKDKIQKLLDAIQNNLKEKALKYREEYSFELDNYEEFKEKIDNPGGFFYMHWCGSDSCESSIKDETKATIRCIPLEQKEEKGKCVYCGKASNKRVVFAKSY